MKGTENSMIQRLADIIWRAVDRLYSLPDDIFDLDDDENAIIEE